MNVTLGHTTFDHVSYDREADVLYMHVGEPSAAVTFDVSPEGHHLRFNASGDLVGVTLLNVKFLLDSEGAVMITIPERLELGRDSVGAALNVA